MTLTTFRARACSAALLVAILLTSACTAVSDTLRGVEPGGFVVMTFNPTGNPVPLAAHYDAVKRDETTSTIFCRGVFGVERTERLVALIEEGEPLAVGSPLIPGSYVGAVLYLPDGTRIITRQTLEVISRSGQVYQETLDQMLRIERALVELAIEGGCEVYEEDLGFYLETLPE